jgi:hypothetical protein
MNYKVGIAVLIVPITMAYFWACASFGRWLMKKLGFAEYYAVNGVFGGMLLGITVIGIILVLLSVLSP